MLRRLIRSRPRVLWSIPCEAGPRHGRAFESTYSMCRKIFVQYRRRQIRMMIRRASGESGAKSPRTLVRRKLRANVQKERLRPALEVGRLRVERTCRLTASYPISSDETEPYDGSDRLACDGRRPRPP